MISFDSLTLKAFTEESRDFLTGARIQKIQQPSRKEVILTIRNNSSTRKLYININPQCAHVCFMSKDNEDLRRISIPQKPPMFCMLLRKYLENARISKINQPPYERILEFYIETFNELSEKIYLCFAIEIMGKHSNIVLYNYDTNIIIGCAHNVGAEKSREREMAGTLPYVYPPKQNKTDILQYNGNLEGVNLSETFYWFSHYFAEQCEHQPVEKLKSFVMLENITPVISADYSEYSLFYELMKGGIRQSSVNEMIDNYYAYHQNKEKLASLQSNYIAETRKKLKKVKNSLVKMEQQAQDGAGYDKFRLYGDLVMANLYNNSDYSSKITVFDYENNKEITLKLDETKTLKENANLFYKKYNKNKTSKLKLDELGTELKMKAAYLEQILYSLEKAENIDELFEIISEFEDDKSSKRKDLNKPSLPLSLEIGGFNVFVGKNNRQNDYIVSKLGKDDDLWFHTKDCAGSHVLLKGTNPPDEVILACCELAKQYSSASNSSKIGVVYTKHKYLRKPPKANPGYVTYKNEKEIIID